MPFANFVAQHIEFDSGKWNIIYFLHIPYFGLLMKFLKQTSQWIHKKAQEVSPEEIEQGGDKEHDEDQEATNERIQLLRRIVQARTYPHATDAWKAALVDGEECINSLCNSDQI